MAHDSKARSLDFELQPVEMARLSNAAAARVMQVYQEAFLALQKIRTSRQVSMKSEMGLE